MCDLPTPARPRRSTFSRRSTKLHLRLRDLRIEVEVEVFDRARTFEARATQSHVELLAVAALDLVGEQAKQKLAVREVVVGRLPCAEVE